MKKLVSSIVLSLFFIHSVYAQSIFTFKEDVSENTTMIINIITTNLVIESENCQYGYTYKIAYEYDIQFYKDGNQLAANEYPKLTTLQWYFQCGINKNGMGNGFSHSNPVYSGKGLSAGIWTDNTNCATATVESLGCTQMEFEYGVDGKFNEAFVDGFPAGLPIELIRFEAEKKPREVVLSWSTASESNNNYFTIERSIDGIQWEELRKIEGAKNSTHQIDYVWTDNQPHPGTSYYRLKQTDFDGKNKTFNIVSVQYDESTALIAFPNPAKDKITLKGIDDTYDLRIFNLMGEEVTKNIQIYSAGEAEMTLDISSLPAGMYFLNNGKNITQLTKF